MARKRRNKRKSSKGRGKGKGKARRSSKSLPLFEQALPDEGPAAAYQEPAPSAPVARAPEEDASAASSAATEVPDDGGTRRGATEEAPARAAKAQPAPAETVKEEAEARLDVEAADAGATGAPDGLGVGAELGLEPQAQADTPSAPGRWKLTPARWDRVMVVWITGALGVWVCSLTMVWCWSLDPSGATTLQAVGGALGGLAAGLALSGPAGGLIQRLVRSDRLKSTLALDLKAEGSRWVGQNDLRAVMRLLSVVTMLAVACGLVSTGIALVSGPLTDWLTRGLLWTRGGWAVLKVVLVLVGMTPIGLGAGMALRGTSLIRGGSGGDPYAAVCREWLWGGAAALAVFAALWWSGVHVVGTMLFMGVALGAAAVVLLQRPEKQSRSRWVASSRGRMGRRLYVLCVLEFGGLGVALVWQGRVLGDCVGVSEAGWAVWLAATLGLLAWFLSAEDARPKPLGPGALAGAGVGAVATVALQVMLGLSALAARGGWPSDSWTVLVLAGLAQIPFCALAAMVLARRRKTVAAADCSVRTYATCAAGGLSAGVLAYWLLAGSGAGWTILAGLTGAAMAGYVALGAVSAVSASRRATWLASGAALLAAWTLGAVGAAEGVGPVSAGSWLTALGERGARRGPGGKAWCGWGVVHRDRWESAAVSEGLRQMVHSDGNGGRWWGVWPDGAGGAPGGGEVWIVRSSVDPGLLGAQGRGAADRVEADFLAATRIGRESVDGIVLAGLPADHPQAWRCYNLATLHRCRKRLTRPNGPMVIRTQVGRDRLALAMPVARTFQRVVGSGWVVLAAGPKGVDLLLAGPKGRLPRPRVAGALVTDLEALLSLSDGAEAISLLGPRAVWSGRRVDAEELVRSLSSAPAR